MRIDIINILLLLLLCLSSSLKAGSSPDPLIIDGQDSVFFDLYDQTINGTTVLIPVYFRSDDAIYSVDFEFKYDQSKLHYDTILFTASYLDGLSYYNQNDSTVRLTSYSFSQPISNDTTLFYIQFTLLSGGQVCAGDMNSLAALLNGDACSELLVDCQPIGMNENPIGSWIRFYPNPADEALHYNGEERFECRILNLEGRVLTICNADEPLSIKHLPSGTYIAQLFKEGAVRNFRIIKR